MELRYFSKFVKAAALQKEGDHDVNTSSKRSFQGGPNMHMALRRKALQMIWLQMSMRRALCAKCGSQEKHENSIGAQRQWQIKRPQRHVFEDGLKVKQPHRETLCATTLCAGRNNPSIGPSRTFFARFHCKMQHNMKTRCEL